MTGENHQASTIVKRSGKRETFDQDKVLKSIFHAGIAYPTASKIVSALTASEFPSTGVLRASMAKTLSKWDPVAATHYVYTRTFKIYDHKDVPQFKVWLHPKTLHQLGLIEGDVVLLQTQRWKKPPVFTEASLDVPEDSVWISEQLSSMMNIALGEKIALRRKSLFDGQLPGWLKDAKVQPS